MATLAALKTEHKQQKSTFKINAMIEQEIKHIKGQIIKPLQGLLLKCVGVTTILSYLFWLESKTSLICISFLCIFLSVFFKFALTFTPATCDHDLLKFGE